MQAMTRFLNKIKFKGVGKSKDTFDDSEGTLSASTRFLIDYIESAPALGSVRKQPETQRRCSLVVLLVETTCLDKLFGRLVYVWCKCAREWRDTYF